jgi:spoIIIJ-associated protein
MDWIEVTAKSVEEAKELALDRLGVVEDELEFEVLDEPSRGLFRRTDARIRARVKPLSREKPVDKRRRRGRGNDRSGGHSSGGSKGRSSSTTAVADSDDENASTPKAAGDGSGGNRSRSRGRRGGRGRSGSGGGDAESRRSDQAGAPAANPSNGDDKAEATVDVETMPVGEQAQHAAEFTGELVRKMGFNATVSTDVEEDDVTVKVEGENLGVLVGPKGVTLQAIEEVVRAAVQRYAGGHAARVHVDVGGYRERRREALVAFTTKIADEVKESGSAKALEPMSAADRKLVHDTVAEIDGVSTVSEGEDPRRRVVIQPE